MPTASSLAWKTIPKSQDAVALQQIKEPALLLWLIVVISVRQSTVTFNIWASLPGAGYGQFEHKADSLIAKFKEAGGTVQRDWCERVLRLSPLWLSASSSACHGLLIITVITPLPTKPSATKCQRTEAGERGNYWHADASAWCCCARCKIHEGLADAEAENDALRDDVAAGRRRLHAQSSLSVSAWSYPAPLGGPMQPPPTGRNTAEQDYFTLREADHYAKTTGRNPGKYINEQCR